MSQNRKWCHKTGSDIISHRDYTVIPRHMAPKVKNCTPRPSLHLVTMRITENQFQTDSQITKNHPKIISEWLMNHWESLRINFTERCRESLRIPPQNNFRLIHESPQIAENYQESISDWFTNHWESISHWFVNYQESLRINFRLICKSLRITENQFQTDLQNHWESPKDKFQTDSQITENCQESISDWFAHHWGSPRINFRLICTSLRITWESHKKCLTSSMVKRAKWHRCMKITAFIVILSDSHWFSVILIDFANHSHFPTWSNPQAWTT